MPRILGIDHINLGPTQLGGLLPVGSVLPIMSHITGSYSPPASGVVKDGFMICDGAAIPGSQAMSGNTPVLNDNRFLMGASVSGTTGGQDTSSGTIGGSQSIAHVHNMNSHTHGMPHTHSHPHTHDNGSLHARIRMAASGNDIVMSQINVPDWTYNRFAPLPGIVSSSGNVATAAAVVGNTGDASPATTGGSSAPNTGGPSQANTEGMSANATVSGSNFTFTGTANGNRPVYLAAIYLMRVN